MNLLTIENLSKTYTGRLLFAGSSFFVQEGEKVGIVGCNGCGKSTLLKIIAGLQEPDAGSLILARHTVISYLPQDPVFEEDESLRANILLQAADETSAVTLLTKLGLYEPDRLVRELSGGQKKRLALAIALSRPADLLLLDEPTNHLDYGMIEWLQKYLAGWRGTLIMVTHDRYFLDEVCSRIVEIDEGRIYSYDASYQGFLELKAERESSARSSELKRRNILRRELEWMRRGARARSTKQKAHIQRYEALAAQEGPKDKESLVLASGATRMGRTTVELEKLCFAYPDRPIVNGFSYIFGKDDRIGFIGSNGCGKTTLLRLIAGELEPDSGHITLGQTIKLGYYDQTVSFARPEERVIDFVKDIGEYIPTPEGSISATMMLERFLFSSEQQYGPISKLSGGERKRLKLLSVLMTAPNVLVLDEPTNDLDTETLAILEDYLEGFQGIVITVSHDRHFLDRIVRRIFAFEGRELHQYEGGYSDYVAKAPVPFWEEDSFCPSSVPAEPAAEKSAPVRPEREKKTRFTFREQKEYDTIEAEIEALEEKLSSLEKEMMSNASDYQKLAQLTAAKEAAEAELAAKYERWEYLEEKAETIRREGQK